MKEHKLEQELTAKMAPLDAASYATAREEAIKTFGEEKFLKIEKSWILPTRKFIEIGCIVGE